MNLIITFDPENTDLAYSCIELCLHLDSINIQYAFLDQTNLLSEFKELFTGNYYQNYEELISNYSIDEEKTFLIALQLKRSKKLRKLVNKVKVKNKIGYNLGFRYSPYTIDLKKGKKDHVQEIYSEILEELSLDNQFHKPVETEKFEGVLSIFYDEHAIEWPVNNWTFFFRNPSLFKYDIKIILTENLNTDLFIKSISMFKNELLNKNEIDIIEKIKQSEIILTFSKEIAFIASYFSKKTILITKEKTIIKPINKDCFIIQNPDIKSVMFDSFLSTFRKLTDEL